MEETYTTNLAPCRICPNRRHPSVSNRFCVVRSRSDIRPAEPDVNIGIKLANWLVSHGYQAVLIRSVEAAIEELRDIRTRLVFVGSGHSEPAAQLRVSPRSRPCSGQAADGLSKQSCTVPRKFGQVISRF